MDIIDKIAEVRIAGAMERGEFDDLPGAGRPLNLDDNRHVPPELRAGYRLLKNAGCIPPEVECRREIRRVEELIAAVDEPGERSKAQRRLSFLLTRLGCARGATVGWGIAETLHRRLAQSG